MGRIGDIFLRIALALPMAWLSYYAWSNWGLGLNLGFYAAGPWWFALTLGLPVLGFLLGCVLALSGSRARWLWVIVVVSGLWLPFGLSWASIGHLSGYWPWWGMTWPSGIPHEAVGTFALDVYAILLALGFVLNSEAAGGREAQSGHGPSRGPAG